MTHAYTIIGLVIVGIASRLLPHPANVTAVTGVAIFAGVRLGFIRGMALSALIMISTDAVLGFHRVMWATYGSLFFIAAISASVMRSRSLRVLPIVLIASSLLFYLITNFAVWNEGVLYPLTFAGLVECYVAGLPFLRNSIVGDLLYTGIFFGVDAWVSRIARVRFSFTEYLWKK